MSTEKKEVAVVDNNSQPFSPAERFTNAVVREFGSTGGSIQITDRQRKLAQNYFIKLDTVLAEAERKRLAKQEQYRDPLAVVWKNVNMTKLAQEVVAFTAIGLDPLQPNHINLIPYKNNGTQKYDIGFIMGYRGMELKAKKYGFEVPDDIVIELVHENDHFALIKKDKEHAIETIEFRVTDAFDRGKVKGGFYHFIFKGNPEKNRVKVFTLADIKKRQPEYASAEFWGGEKEVWATVDGKRVKQKVHTDGWFEEMCWKTVARAAFNAITIDSEKIDEYLMKVIQKEFEAQGNKQIQDVVQEQVQEEIATNANTEEIAFHEEVQEAQELPQATGEEIVFEKTDVQEAQISEPAIAKAKEKGAKQNEMKF